MGIEVEAGGATTYTTKSGGHSACCLVIWGVIMYVVAASLYGTAFWFSYSAQQNNRAQPTALIYIFWALGGACSLTGLVCLIASCVKCCCTDQKTVYVDGNAGGVVSYEIGGAPVQGDVEVEIEVGSDTQFLGGVDVEVEVEVEAPEIEVEIEAPEVEVEVEVEAEVE